MKIFSMDAYREDAWQLADDGDLDQAGKIIVPWARRDDFPAHRYSRAEIGVRLDVDHEIDADAQAYARFPLLAIDFTPFTDGRGYSLARILRRRGYTGDLRALGEVQRDQIGFLRRCGFSSVVVTSAAHAASLELGLNTFSEVYQGAADGRSAIPRLRWQRRATIS